jgi:hypothetical protein
MTLDIDTDPDIGTDDGPDVVSFLSRVDVAHRIGLKSVRSLSGMTLPPHDARIGVHRGWKPDTIDVWQSNRPGRGRWGARA